MKVFALGGGGEFGLPAVRLLAQSDVVTEITVAGRTLERAEHAARLAGSKASAVQVDAADAERLASLVAGSDILMNTAGRTADLRRAAMDAAMRAGAHYCDLDDPGPLREFDDRARAAGITAVTGNGFSPGLLNVLRVHAAQQLDDVQEIQMGAVMAWSMGFRLVRALASPADVEEVGAAIGEAVASYYSPERPETPIEYWLRQPWAPAGESVRCWRDGAWATLDPVADAAEIPLPGERETSARAQSVARGRGEPPTVALQFTGFVPQLDDLVREQAGRVSAGEATAADAAATVLETVNADRERWLAPPPGWLPLPFFWCTVLGHRDGRPARYTYWPAADLMSEANWLLMTGAPLVIAVLDVLTGAIQRRGVMTPRTLFDAPSLFERVAALLPEPPAGGEPLLEALDFLD